MVQRKPLFFENGEIRELPPEDTIFGANSSEVFAIASGNALALQQSFLATDGQVGLSILAVGLTNTGKVQGTSLSAGNVVEVFLTPSDFLLGNVLYREFMKFGENICFTNLQTGSIIRSSGGFYGFSENDFGSNLTAPMALLSLGLAFTDSFVFSFRQSNRTQDNNAFLFITNGAVASTVLVSRGDGSAIADEPSFELAPFEFRAVHLDGDGEYRMLSSNPIMVCTAAGFDNSDFQSPLDPASLGPRDPRVLMPVTSDGITHPRFGQISAPFDGTSIDYFVSNGAEGSFSVSPGSPVDIQVETAQAGTDYRPDQFTRFSGTGVFIGNSGADGAGGNATPLVPLSVMAQVIAQPFFVNDSGNGDQTSITIFGPYRGTAKIWEFDETLQSLVLAYTIPLERLGAPAVTDQSSPSDQMHPVAGQLSNEPDSGVIQIIGNLRPGIITSDVIVAAIIQTNFTTSGESIKSQNGTTTSPIRVEDDETLMLGITPKNIACEIREDANGLLRKRVISGLGVETWEYV